MSPTNRPNRKAIIEEIRYQMRYSNSPEDRSALQNRLDFWLNYNPNQSF